jgi:hypothetical protein
MMHGDCERRKAVAGPPASRRVGVPSRDARVLVTCLRLDSI